MVWLFLSEGSDSPLFNPFFFSPFDTSLPEFKFKVSIKCAIAVLQVCGGICADRGKEQEVTSSPPVLVDVLGCSGGEEDASCSSRGLVRPARSQVTVMFNNDYHHAPAPPH